MTNNLDEARNIIGQMSEEDFINFQTELQYAATWNSKGYEAVQRCILAQDQTEDAVRRGLFDKADQFQNRTKEICESPLYQVVREELKKRVDSPAEVPEDWCGWLREGFQLEDINRVKEAVGQVFKRSYEDLSVRASWGLAGAPQRLKEQITKAQGVLEKYGFKGVFTGEGDLLELFMKHYKLSKLM